MRKTMVYWFVFLAAVLISGCQTKPAPVHAKVAAQAPPVLAPMPVYPPEKAGWKTDVALMLFPNGGNLTGINNELRKALEARQYVLVEPPRTEADWLSVKWRHNVKMIIASFGTGYSSPVFDGNRSSDICLQVLVVDQRAFDGLNEDSASPRVRTFHVWSRQKHPANLDVNAVYNIHAPELAKNLMCLPAFREALQ